MVERYQWLGTLARPSLWRQTGDTPVYVGHVEPVGVLGWLAVTSDGQTARCASLEVAAAALCRLVGAPDIPSGLAEVGGGGWVDKWTE